MFWLQAIGLPYLALIALVAIGGGRGRTDSFYRKAIDFGIDACILGIGVTGGIFVSSEAQKGMGAKVTALALTFTFIDLIVTGICLRLREWTKPTERWRAGLSIFSGTLILAINTGILLKIA